MPEMQDDHPIRRATEDTWYFYAGMSSGLVVHFTHAEIRGEWVCLSEPTVIAPRINYPSDVAPMFLGRGMWVRMSSIEWCVDQDS